MKEEKTTALRQRMIEDMRIRAIGETTQKGHIRAVKHFAIFFGRSPDTATPGELRAYQLHMTDTEVTTSTFNTRIVSLQLFFGVTCGHLAPPLRIYPQSDRVDFGAKSHINHIYDTLNKRGGTLVDKRHGGPKDPVVKVGERTRRSIEADTQLFRKDGYGSTIEIGFWNARDKAFPSTKHPVQLKPVSSEKTVFVSNIPKQGL
jgi:hypothetical protein